MVCDGTRIESVFGRHKRKFRHGDQRYRLSLLTRGEHLLSRLYYAHGLDTDVLNHFIPVVTILRSQMDTVEEFYQYTAPTRAFVRGRPRYAITCDQLLYLVELDFEAAEIATLLGVSRRTGWRRIREYGIETSTTYTDMSNYDLDTVVSGIRSSFPNCGQRMTDGYLRVHRVSEYNAIG